MTLTLPTRLGRYELLVELGSGGMATVYLARHVGPAGYARHVALKLLHPHMRSDPQAIVGFVQEARLASELRHPNIVPVLDVDDSSSEGLFMVMDHVEGGSLSSLYRNPFGVPLPIGLRLLTDALAGLHHAHQHRDPEDRPLRMVHRDFTPHNILVGVDGVAKLTDFGIAKILGAMQVTTTGSVKGKVSYMAPEQAAGRQLDARADIWAAGVVAWELAAKRRLYGGDNEAAVLLKIVGERPPRVKTVRPDVAAALDEAIARALEPEPDKRYASADAFRTALLAAFPEVADLAETSAFVRQAFSESLTARRQAISQSLERAATAGPAGAISAANSGLVSAAQAGTTTGSRRRSARVLVAAVGAIALILGGAAAFALSRPAKAGPGVSKAVDTGADGTSSVAIASEPAAQATTLEAAVEAPRAPQDSPSAAPLPSRALSRPRTTPRPKPATPRPAPSATLPALLGSPYNDR